MFGGLPPSPNGLAKAAWRGNFKAKEHNTMTIHLPEHLERYVHDQVQAGFYPTEDEVISDAPERHRQARQRHTQATDQPELTPEDIADQELQRRLLAAGIISEIKPPITDFTPYQNRRAVPIQGEPISETAIRERR
jgi:Arc/MetJ-type ribon-helix-helix transcriptional regulator